MISINAVNLKGVTQKYKDISKKTENITQIQKQNTYSDIDYTKLFKQRLCHIPSFSGNDKKPQTDFIKWAEETQFTQKTLPAIINNPQEYIIGKGFTHTTYKIPGNENYIIRTSNHIANISDIDYTDCQLINKKDDNIDINIGQEVAEVQYKTKDGIPFLFEILNKQEGQPIGVPPSEVLYNEDTGELKPGAIPYEATERKQQYANSLEKLAKLPVESYEKLISDLEIAANAGYTFDHLNSNNLLLDEKAERINLIDMDKSNRGVDYGNVLYALTNINYFPTYASEYDSNPVPDDSIKQAIKDTITITDKYTQAMKNQGVTFSVECPSLEFAKFLRSFPVAMMVKSFDENKINNYFVEKGVVQ